MFDFISKLDGAFLSSYEAVRQLFVLAAGGGVFGIIANNDLHRSMRTGEAILWVAVYAWVTTLLDFTTQAFGKKVLTGWGRVCHLIWVTAIYIVVTTTWGVYDTFITYPAQPKQLTVFILALIVTVSYFTELLCAGWETRNQKCCEEASPAVVENGKEEPAKSDEQEQAKSSD